MLTKRSTSLSGSEFKRGCCDFGGRDRKVLFEDLARVPREFAEKFGRTDAGETAVRQLHARQKDEHAVDRDLDQPLSLPLFVRLVRVGKGEPRRLVEAGELVGQEIHPEFALAEREIHGERKLLVGALRKRPRELGKVARVLLVGAGELYHSASVRMGLCLRSKSSVVGAPCPG